MVERIGFEPVAGCPSLNITVLFKSITGMAR